MHSSLDAIDARAWNALVGAGDPFMEYEFLHMLEVSRAVGEGTGWDPRYITLHRGKRLIGAVAFYLRWDSYGEYIFDWQWADAYHRAQIAYYPKITAAVPFTPVTGSRILVHPDESYEPVASALVAALLQTARDQEVSGLHVLFPTEQEHRMLEGEEFLPRLTYQFHWLNRDYGTFDDFLADMRSAKRKDIRKERRGVEAQDLEIEVIEGDDVRDEHLDALWRFYMDTTGRKWGDAYLNRTSFELLGQACRQRLVLVMARERGGDWVGGTLNLRKGKNLYGRYWGCRGYYPGLHFECCYYRLIEYAIERGVELFEAGAQGEHKFLRGFVTRPTYSSHWLAHPGGREAIRRFLDEERCQVQATIAHYNSLSPLKYVRSGEI